MLGQQQAMLGQQAMLEQQQQHEFPELPEDSPELKTPTAEDIMVPEQKVCTILEFQVIKSRDKNFTLINYRNFATKM